MTTLPTIVSATRVAALGGTLAIASACAPGTSQPPSGPPTVASMSAPATPVLLSCPAGQQPLLRQVLVNGVPVSQVECVTTGPATLESVVPMAPAAVPRALVAAPAVAAAPLAQPVAYTVADPPVSVVRPRATRVVRDDIVEYRRPSKRSWQKSAVIIGSAAGAGAGVGALTGGKKGALIGAAVGGGAATLWDQITRRSPR